MTIILPPGSTSTDLQAAINNAVSGDMIIISDNMPFADMVTIPTGKSITIQSTTGNNWVLTQASAQIRHFLVNGNLILQDVTLDGGSIGGGIQVNPDASISLKNGAIVKNCMSTGNGGGINANNGILTIDGGDIINNISGGSGGGIYSIGANSSVQLLTGTINNNNAKDEGGGACAVSMSMHGGSINYNYTDGGSGGGLYIMTSFEMTDGEISYNEIRPHSEQKTASGGGLYCSGTLGAPTSIIGGRIHHNKVGFTPNGSRGGGICIFRGVKFYMSGGEVYENEAPWGGGIFFDAYMQYGIPEENTVITGNTFIHDNHGVQGGGICFYNNVPGDPDIGLFGMAPQLSGNVRITENSASYGGGILFYPFLASYTPTQLMMNATISGNVEISGNKAVSRGGGIDIQDDNKGRGVIAALNIIGNVVISKNEATTNPGTGGGIYAMNSNLKMEGSILDGNTVNIGNGGGIYLRGNGKTEIINGCSITNNRALNGDGGGIFTEASDDYENPVTDNSTIFSCNRAQTAYEPPEDASTLYPNIQFAGTTITDHPLNNFDINYNVGEPIDVYSNVSYDANGGVGSYTGPDIMPGGTDTVLSLTETGISRPDYTLAGWNTLPDGSGTAYNPGDTIIVNCNVRLYAQWGIIETYAIIYDCNGGRGAYTDHCRELEIYYTVLSTNQTGISRSGFLFTGWSTQRDGSGAFYYSGAIIGVSNDMTLYAQWRAFPNQIRLCRATATKSRKPIEGQILWIDNDNADNTRPPSVEIILLRDGEIYRRTNADSMGDGYFGFCCLPVGKNSVHKYNYQIDETAVPRYATTIEGYNIINTLTP